MKIPESTIINSLRQDLKSQKEVICAMKSAILELCDVCHTEIDGFDCNKHCNDCPLNTALKACDGIIL